MTLLFCDSCDHYNDNTYGKYKKWHGSRLSFGSPTSAVQAKTGTRSLDLAGSASYVNEYNKGSGFSADTVFVQFHFYQTFSDLTQPYYEFLRFYNTSNALQSTLRVYGQRLQIMRGSTVVDENTDYYLEIGMWHFIQVKWTVSDSLSTNDLIVKVDGNEILNPSSGDTADQANTTLQYVKFLGSFSTNKIYADNIVIIDDQGANNTGLTSTDTFIEDLMPNAGGNYSQWVTSGGTNYLMVDEANPDEDTTYVESGTAGNKDSYNFDNIAAASPTILAVAANIVAKETTGTSRDIKQFSRISSTDYEQAGVFSPVGSTYYEYDQYIWEDSPATAIQWTDTELNAAEFGVKVET